MAIARRYSVELGRDSFTRYDDTPDLEHYAAPQASCDLDAEAAARARQVVAFTIGASGQSVLDVMAGADSCLSPEAQPARVVGIGPDAGAMQANPVLHERVVQDLGAEPALPFEEQSFDTVLCSAVMGYLTRPHELFSEVLRVLRPGGLFLVVFDNTVVKDRVVKYWRRGSEEERLAVVSHLFEYTRGFETPQVRVTRTRPRTDESGTTRPGRPVYAVFSARLGGDTAWAEHPAARRRVVPLFSPEEIAERKKQVGETLRCPYCDEPMTRCKVPDTPFCEWDAEYLWVCFAEHCPFSNGSLAVMREQGNLGVSYRLMYHPDRDSLYTVADVGFGDGG